MKRKEFISKLGAGAAFAVASTCLCGCVKMDDPAPPVDVSRLNLIKIEDGNFDFTLDLNKAANEPLKMNGGYVIIDNKCVVARTNNGDYIAATRTCSDQNLRGIVWSSSLNQWECVEHSATFDESGNGTTVYNNLGNKGLAIYNTQLNGNLLRVYS
jgi:hypothetical protein